MQLHLKPGRLPMAATSSGSWMLSFVHLFQPGFYRPGFATNIGGVHRAGQNGIYPYPFFTFNCSGPGKEKSQRFCSSIARNHWRCFKRRVCWRCSPWRHLWHIERKVFNEIKGAKQVHLRGYASSLQWYALPVFEDH